MNLNFTPSEAAFREEVHGFLRRSLDVAVHRKLQAGIAPSKQELVQWQRSLNQQGWAVPHWPREWGGTGWTPIEHYIFQDELQQWPAPAALGFNVEMVGPVIAAFGSEAQKRHFLPRAANLDDWWCQGFSEPGAGSDLASMRTSARRAGDHYYVKGHKTWTTYAQYADWIFCLVRTDAQAKKQEGISFLLIDMKSPGITVRPVTTIDGGHEINEVLLEDVRVPVENRVGEENRGWDYAKYLLSRERTSIARIGASKERLRRIRTLAARVVRGRGSLLEDESFLERLIAVEIELQALEMTQLRALAAAQDGGHVPRRPDPFSSLLKIKGSEIQQAISELLLEVAGPQAMHRRSVDSIDTDDWAASAAPTYFNWRKLSIYGGSNEIQRNIIAKAILGL
jgi:pimeloyl-CoA dehydrogenase large subunit